MREGEGGLRWFQTSRCRSNGRSVSSAGSRGEPRWMGAGGGLVDIGWGGHLDRDGEPGCPHRGVEGLLASWPLRHRAWHVQGCQRVHQGRSTGRTELYACPLIEFPASPFRSPQAIAPAPANRSVARTSASVIPGASALWPASSTTTSSERD